MPASYPADSLDMSGLLRSYLGSYWERFYPDPPGLDALLLGRTLLARRSGTLATQALECLDRLSIPVLQEQSYASVVLEYSLSTVYPGGYSHGNPRDRRTYPASSDLIQLDVIADRPGNPTRILIAGIDFLFDPAAHTLTLVDDPTQGADTVTLLAQDGRYDKQLPWIHAGYLVGIRLSSSSRYLQLVNAVLDASYNGPSEHCLLDALEAVSDSPRSTADGEVVEQVYDDGYSQLVITDRSLYKVGRAATVNVAVGDTLTAGTQLSDAVTLLTPPLDVSLAPSEIAVPAELLDPSLAGPVRFENTSVAITVTENVSGYTKITWTMPGDAGIATAFFTLLHSRGVAATHTLANYLDTRPPPQSTQPTAASLPLTVNPADLLLNGVFRNHWRVAILKVASFGPDALGVDVLPWLRQLNAPEQGLLVVTS